LISLQWELHTPVVVTAFTPAVSRRQLTLWTFVNRNEFDVGGRQIQIPQQKDARYFDLWNGAELKPELHDGQAVLSFSMEAHGYGAVLASASAVMDLDRFLAEMKALAKTPLASFSPERRLLSQKLVPIAPVAHKASAPPEGMIRIPAGAFRFRISGMEIEGKNEIGVDVQYPWENSPRRHHDHTMNLPSYYVDRYPVTNEQFGRFMAATHYHPKDDHNFLRDWKNGSFPPGGANKPVTWVSLEDARAYAAWAGKRLPHEWEWQYAAQGADGRLYPWGSEWDEAAVARPDTGRTCRWPRTHPPRAARACSASARIW
jgi:formylglycine-generating enzyme required for sulfatase activity